MKTLVIDHDKFEATSKRSAPVLSEFESNPIFRVVHVDQKNLDSALHGLSSSSIFITHSPKTAERIATEFPNVKVYLIEKPLNIGYIAKNPTITKAWCWDDIYIHEYRSS